MMPATPLTPHQQRFLRGLAHPLQPVVQIGIAGLTPAVVKELSSALERHELIKVRVNREAPTPASDLAADLEQATGSSVVQVIGHVLVAYRARLKDPKIVLPRKRKKQPARQA